MRSSTALPSALPIPRDFNGLRNTVNTNTKKDGSSNHRCPDKMFACGSGKCIPQLYVCDGDQDCEDGSDEKEFCRPKTRSCEDKEFDCGNGKCIPSLWVCDSEVDCKETKADEDPAICQNFECKADQFTCHKPGNGTNCIPLNWVCDSKRDCSDGSDEVNCNTTCTSEEFTCASGKCIPLMWHCDGDSDCDGDGSGEVDCPKKECSAHETSCANGDCIMRDWVCDGEFDCMDESDEQNCGDQTLIPFKCMEGEILCDRTMICIQKSYLCDGDPDCPDGVDESDRYCSPSTCPSDSFTCGDTACIPKDLVCNGFTECADGSDERNCTSSKCNPETEFHCGNRCISSSLVCDGKADCENGLDESDEATCSRNECQEHNGGCSQLCVDTKPGFHCACKPGFMLVGETQCQDIDECLEPGICSQVCTNLKGSFKCECVAGYAKDPHDPSRCKATEGHPSLLFADYYDVRKISLDHDEVRVTSIVNETNGAAALDFVFKTGMIFWTDAKDRCIYKAPIDEGMKKEIVIDKDLTNTDGLAVDWIYNHIYWTNAETNTVEVSDFNGSMRKVLFRQDISEPRAIALYPMEGWMFWTDWGADAKIERAGMDGTHREAIVTRDIKWPNGIAVDQVLRKVYWVDSKKHTISSCDFDGSNRRVIIFSKEHLPHPFSISLFEDTLYFTDWTKGAVMQANKFTGSDLKAVSRAHSSPMTVHVYHSYRQPNATNHCTPLNGLCTHLCLPAPQISPSMPKITCACPENLRLMKDGLTCELPEQTPKSPKLTLNEGILSTKMGHPSISGPDEGKVAVAAILAAVVVLCFTSGIAYLVFIYYRKHSAYSMNFDNPIYKKTTTEDGLNMAQHGVPGEVGGRTSLLNGRNGSLRDSLSNHQYTTEEGICEPMMNALKF